MRPQSKLVGEPNRGSMHGPVGPQEHQVRDLKRAADRRETVSQPIDRLANGDRTRPRPQQPITGAEVQARDPMPRAFELCGKPREEGAHAAL
jgi:hypothetical protein